MATSTSEAPRPEDVELVEATDPGIGELTTTHLARFEFSDAGTKILMVEWAPDAVEPPAADAAAAGQDPGANVNAPADHGPWEVSWPGKQTFLPARDSEQQLSPTASDPPSSAPSTRRRIFFLLPPTSPVPADITITPPSREPIKLKPLPAIFPEGFFLDEAAGPRGVLHTIWAKKRLKELQKEIEDEMRSNAESVGVEMALAEKQWISDNFLPQSEEKQVIRGIGDAGMTPISPRSPIGGRLGEKLKGLKLGTSPADLTPSPTANTFTNAGSQPLTLSPTGGDVAVSSFSSIPRSEMSTVGAPAAAPISLNAAVNTDVAANSPPKTDDDDGLFALPISPRSPDMKVMPFSQLR